MSLRKQLKNFAEHTSMHGFRRIIVSKKPEKRVAWVIVFVAAWTLFAYQLTSVLTKYFEYSKKTTTEFVAGGAPFPAITLCNMQSLDFYIMHKFLESIRAVESSAEYNTTDFKFVAESLRENPFTFNSFLMQILFEKHRLHHPMNQSDMADFAKLLSRMTFAVNLPGAAVEQIAMKESEFVVKCSYGDADCNFKEIRDSYYLKCFTFEPHNPKNTSFDGFESLSEGIANGFSATLLTGIKFSDSSNTDTWLPGVYETDSPLSGSSGIRVVIHPPGTEPFPLTEGYDVPPGFQASIGIVPERRKRLAEPYGVCERKNRYKKNYVDQWHGFETDKHEPYRKISCERMCMQQQVIKECNCFDETLPDTGNIHCIDDVCFLVDGNDSRPTRHTDMLQVQEVKSCRHIAFIEECALRDNCNATNVNDTIKNIKCADEVIKRLMTNLRSLANCDCYAPCDEFRYHVSYSLAKWPSSGYEMGSVISDIFGEEAFFHRFDKDKREMYEKYIERSGFEAVDDFAKINVYITDSNVMQITEEPATTITQLISEIGGQLGIWIGVSVITISEVLETLLKITTVGFRRLYRKFRIRRKDLEDEITTGPNLV